MPSGYTHRVQTGEVTDFAEFAWDCARGMGALIMMRDAPRSTPIPERFEPNTEWHEEQLTKARSQLAKVQAWTDAEALREQRTARTQSAKNEAERDEDIAVSARRYNEMIAAVEAWEPPSPDHEGLKLFMLDQLSESLKFDCTPYRPDRTPVLSGPLYRDKQAEFWQKEIDYHTSAIAEEIERTESRNEWLRLLRESVPMPTQETQPA